MKTIIYLRTSTTEQNPENQLKDCLSIIEPNTEYEVMQEQQSAYKIIERPVFESIKKRIKSKKFSKLIVWDLDRLYRNRKKLIAFFELCKAYGVVIYSFRQQWLNDLHKIPEPWNEIVHSNMLDIFGWIAEDESRKKSERIKNAVRQNSKGTFSYKGNKWGRKPLSTFKRKRIAELHNSGHSIRQISERLNISVGSVHKTIREIHSKNY